MKALVTGITGQIGSYLAEHLIDNDIEVHGTIRRHSVVETQNHRIDHLQDKIKTHYADLTDVSSLEKVLEETKPDLIFNLGALSHVKIGGEQPNYCLQSNTIGVLNLIEAMKSIVPKARMSQSSSSEMFGNSKVENGYQNEDTPMNPVSVYGISKLASYHLMKHYRSAHNMFLCNSICFNNESSRRGTNFVTNKIVTGALSIKLGLQDKLYLGNLKSRRDWSHSQDIAEAMLKIIKHDKPDDFVIASGQTRSVQEFCHLIFSLLGMDYNDHVEIDPKFYRPEELHYLQGDSSKARKELNWTPKFSFMDLVSEMINNNKLALENGITINTKALV